MNETRVHVVITDVRRSNPQHASSVVNVPSRAGQARFRAAALSQRCSFVNGATRSLVCGALWLPNLCKKGEGQVVCASLFLAHRNHRSRDDGTESSSGRINWGPSAGQALRAIMMKPAVAGRSSDVVIVSDEAGGQHNRWRSQGPLGRCVASDAVSAAGRESDYGIKRARKRKPLWTRQSHREVAKGVSDSLLEAVLGKTRRTEFQRGQGKRNERSDGHLPRCPKGLTQRKPLTYSCSRLCSTRPLRSLRPSRLCVKIRVHPCSSAVSSAHLKTPKRVSHISPAVARNELPWVNRPRKFSPLPIMGPTTRCGERAG